MTNVYYNENDKRAAAWLRELMRQNLIPKGTIDERSIHDVRGGDLRGFTQCHFFAGIGGWPLALLLALWPWDKPVWTGSCPRQPFSIAGKGRGKKDARHLWPEFFRLIGECRPAIVFGEQVASKAGRKWLAGVFADLEGLAYACAGADLCAAGIGAPHIRQRLFWVADSLRAGRPEGRAKSRNGQASRRGGFGGVADAGRKFGGGFENQQKPSVENQTIGGEKTILLGGCGQVGGMAQSPSKQWIKRSNQFGEFSQPSNSDSTITSRIGRLEHANGSGRGEQCGTKPVESPFTGIECAGAWSDYDILPCLDGKSRRVESGTFPLAHGVPGRVGLLRGYGNAIVPQLAAEFIRAYCEVT